jgi:hypothetical protein
VFNMGDPGLLGVAQSLLQDAGIEYFMWNEALHRLYPGSIPTFAPALAVRASDAAAAREVLRGLGDTSDEKR